MFWLVSKIVNCNVIVVIEFLYWLMKVMFLSLNVIFLVYLGIFVFIGCGYGGNIYIFERFWGFILCVNLCFLLLIR